MPHDIVTRSEPGASSPVRRRWLGLAVALAGTFMSILDIFIVNVAVPSLQRDLGASYADVELVIAGYGLAYAVALISGGRLGDLYGRRRAFMAGLAAFIVASTLCGLAPGAHFLILARLLQGLAAAVMFPQVFSLIRVGFPDERARATAFAAMGAVLGLAAIVGQLLGGVLVAANLCGLAWRPVFLVNVPLGVAAFVAAPFFIEESRSATARRLDPVGMLLSAAGLFLLLYPLIESREAGWPLWSLAMLAAAAPVLALFAWHQHAKSRRGAPPLLETRLFRNRSFVLGVVLVLVFYSTQNSFYLALSLLLQAGLGQTPWQAGLVFTPLALAFTAASLVAGRAAPRRRTALLLAGAVTALAAFALAGIVAALRGAELTATEIIPALVLLGLGCGLLLTPLLNAVLSRVPESDAGAASGMISTMQQVGGAIGVAAVGIIFFGRLNGDATYAAAFAAASLYNVGAALATLLLLLLLERPRRSSATLP